MIDLTKIQYRAIVVDEKGRQYNIRDYIENFGWEENEGELAMRISFTAQNDKTSKGYLSSLIKLGCLVAIFATDGGSMDKEVARGYVTSWNPSWQNSGNVFKCICYDELYNLQKSQDNLYFPSGTGTKSAIEGILNACGVPIETYRGPNATHGKTKCNNNSLADIILELIGDAVKKGEEKCILRASGGKAQIMPRGSNKKIYVLQFSNTKSISETRSIASLVTRVKVVGQSDDDGRSSVEVTLDGLTKYGIRQKIYTRGSDETIEAAKSAAQEILNSEGTVEKELTVQGPDVPFIRKGDLIYLMGGVSKGYFYVKGIRHDADSMSMSMELEKAETEKVKSGNSEAKNDYSVGDVVNFHGGTHYVSSYPGAKGYAAKAGKAKITSKDGSGEAHPWHLIHEDGDSNVYGWVDNGTFD